MVEVLQFGGGRDSLACLYLLRDKWPTLIVAWLNTGAAFPETLEQMDAIRLLVPNFLEITSDVIADQKRNGWPSDVIPMANTGFGKATTGEQGIQIRSWYDCCSQNMWQPLHAKMIEIGATRIYRGQRNQESYKSPMRSGVVVDGVEYVHPLEDWTERQVDEYLAEQGVSLPLHYKHTQKSLDCWTCTAYLDAKLDQLHYLKKFHPMKFRIVSKKLKQIDDAIRLAHQPIEDAAQV